MDNIGHKLKALREENGMSQRHLAEQVGVTYVHLSSIEMGHRRPGWKLLKRLAAAMGYEPAVILTPDTTTNMAPASKTNKKNPKS